MASEMTEKMITVAGIVQEVFPISDDEILSFLEAERRHQRQYEQWLSKSDAHELAQFVLAVLSDNAYTPWVVGKS